MTQEPWKIKRVGIAMAIYSPESNFDPLAEQLESIRNQTFKEWICVICSDSPLNALLQNSKFTAFRNDPRFQWYENTTRLGHKKNFERAAQLLLKQSPPTLPIDAIGFSDQDDIWYPDKLKISVEALENTGKLAVVHSDMHILRESIPIDPSITGWKLEKRGVHHVSLSDLLVRNIVAGCAMLMDAELVRRYPTIPNQVQYHDRWYALLGSAHAGVIPIYQPLFAYRQHPMNVLGIQGFKGILSAPKDSKSRGLLGACLTRWIESHLLAQALNESKVPLSLFQKITFLASWDLGLGFLWIALKSIWTDRPLARASLARAVGKFYECIKKVPHRIS